MGDREGRGGGLWRGRAVCAAGAGVCHLACLPSSPRPLSRRTTRPQELSRRCETLIRLIEKENEDEEERSAATKGGAKRGPKPKLGGGGGDSQAPSGASVGRLVGPTGAALLLLLGAAVEYMPPRGCWLLTLCLLRLCSPPTSAASPDRRAPCRQRDGAQAQGRRQLGRRRLADLGAEAQQGDVALRRRNSSSGRARVLALPLGSSPPQSPPPLENLSCLQPRPAAAAAAVGPCSLRALHIQPFIVCVYVCVCSVILCTA